MPLTRDWSFTRTPPQVRNRRSVRSIVRGGREAGGCDEGIGLITARGAPSCSLLGSLQTSAETNTDWSSFQSSTLICLFLYLIRDIRVMLMESEYD